jgi:hypothetical protein
VSGRSEPPASLPVLIRKRPPEEARRRLRASGLPPDFTEGLIEELGIAEPDARKARERAGIGRAPDAIADGGT